MLPLVLGKFLGVGLLGVILAHVYQTLPNGLRKWLCHSILSPPALNESPSCSTSSRKGFNMECAYKTAG